MLCFVVWYTNTCVLNDEIDSAICLFKCECYLLLFGRLFVLGLGRVGKLTGIIKQHGKCAGCCLLVSGDCHCAFGVANL